MSKYFLLEKIENDPLTRRVIPCGNKGQAYRLWLENSVNRIIVKEIELEVVEK